MNDRAFPKSIDSVPHLCLLIDRQPGAWQYCGYYSTKIAFTDSVLEKAVCAGRLCALVDAVSTAGADFGKALR
jgi:hypothetical protein